MTLVYASSILLLPVGPHCYLCAQHLPALTVQLLVAGILRRTSIELGSGTVSFDVSLLSDLTSQQKAIMTNLQVLLSSVNTLFPLKL